MAITQNFTLTTKDWTELPVAGSTITIEATDTASVVWTDGSTPAESLRGHYIGDHKNLYTGPLEKLWVSTQIIGTIIIYTVVL